MAKQYMQYVLIYQNRSFTPDPGEYQNPGLVQDGTKCGSNQVLQHDIIVVHYTTYSEWYLHSCSSVLVKDVWLYLSWVSQSVQWELGA